MSSQNNNSDDRVVISFLNPTAPMAEEDSYQYASEEAENENEEMQIEVPSRKPDEFEDIQMEADEAEYEERPEELSGQPNANLPQPEEDASPTLIQLPLFPDNEEDGENEEMRAPDEEPEDALQSAEASQRPSSLNDEGDGNVTVFLNFQGDNAITLIDKSNTPSEILDAPPLSDQLEDREDESDHNEVELGQMPENPDAAPIIRVGGISEGGLQEEGDRAEGQLTEEENMNASIVEIPIAGEADSGT